MPVKPGIVEPHRRAMHLAQYYLFVSLAPLHGHSICDKEPCVRDRRNSESRVQGVRDRIKAMCNMQDGVNAFCNGLLMVKEPCGTSE